MNSSAVLVNFTAIFYVLRSSKSTKGSGFNLEAQFRILYMFHRGHNAIKQELNIDGEDSLVQHSC